MIATRSEYQGPINVVQRQRGRHEPGETFVNGNGLAVRETDGVFEVVEVWLRAKDIPTDWTKARLIAAFATEREAEALVRRLIEERSDER